MNPDDARRVLAEAELICPEATVQAAIERLAAEITAALADANPLVLTVMNGGLFFAGQLLPKLDFPLECDYLHATRYGAATTGGKLQWLTGPHTSVAGRCVLLLDDILDAGLTLAAIRDKLLADGAARCLVAVLSEKDTGQAKPLAADFIGVRLPNRFVFGCGMDIHGAWRNLAAIYAIKEN